MGKWHIRTILLLVFIFIALHVQGQRVFLPQVGELNRRYFVTSPSSATSNLPLFIILEETMNSDKVQKWSSLLQKGGVRAAYLSFPVPKEQWHCNQAPQADNDLQLLTRIIEESYINFHINRNKVYLVTDAKSNCLAEKFKATYPQRSTGVILSSESVGKDSLFIARELNPLSQNTAGSDTTYALWSLPVIGKVKSSIDSLKKTSWHKRLSVEFRAGGFLMLGSVKTNISDKTYMDASDAHSLIGIHMTRWMDDSTAWFVDISRLKIPQKQEVEGDRVQMGGGMIMPITIGFKYALHRYKLRPYFMLGTGPMTVMVFGGKFSKGASMSSIRNKINAEVRMAMQTTLGAGIDGRLGKRIIYGGNLRYIHSSEFDSAGYVNAIRGFSGSFSIGYILGANKSIY